MSENPDPPLTQQERSELWAWAIVNGERNMVQAKLVKRLLIQLITAETKLTIKDLTLNTSEQVRQDLINSSPIG